MLSRAIDSPGLWCVGRMRLLCGIPEDERKKVGWRFRIESGMTEHNRNDERGLIF